MFLRVRDIRVSEDSAVFTLAGIVADRAARLISDCGMIVHSHSPLLRGMRRNGHVFRILRWLLGLIGKELASLVISIYETTARTAGRAPQPFVADMRIQLHVGWNRL